MCGERTGAPLRLVPLVVFSLFFDDYEQAAIEDRQLTLGTTLPLGRKRLPTPASSIAASGSRFREQ